MSCNGCANGRGVCSAPAGCRNNGTCASGGCNKLQVFDWLANVSLPDHTAPFNVVEIRFKNGRKEFFRNDKELDVVAGDTVAVEATSGHDVGVVSAVGELVRLQMKKKKIGTDIQKLPKIYRKARQADIDKWREAQEQELPTMLKARKIAEELQLVMKISDVEYQGDKAKAIFYYTADERVDFRELIKRLATEFRIRVEMKQIGIRQEAGRLGGIGSCGRELCCSTWLTDFRSVSTNAARYQQLSINPQKLAGQCGKLKCCLNYELDGYMEAIEDFPDTGIKLETGQGVAIHQKTDIFKRQMWYTYEEDPGNFICLGVDKVKEVIAMNKKGKTPYNLREYELAPEIKEAPSLDYANVIGQDSITRFDKKKIKKKKNKRKSQSL